MALTGTAVSRAIRPSAAGRAAPGSTAGVNALSIVVVVGRARTVTNRPCRKVDALFGVTARSYGVNSPEFGFQFAPSRPSRALTVDIVTRPPWSLHGRRHESRSETV